MGSVYARGDLLWLAFVDATGKRRLRSSGLRVGRENEARATLHAIERQVAAELRLGDEAEAGPPTVAGYARRFVRARKAAGVGSASQEEGRFRDYINPFEVDGVTLGSMPLKDVRPHHVRDFVRHLRALPAPKLAPRTVRHIYGHLRTMFHEAVTDELVPATPCVLKKGVLPKKADKDPSWRALAVYSRGEVEQLISDERIPLLRRVRYRVLFLGAMRIGELAARSWRDWDPDMSPLGRLLVPTSWDRKKKLIKGTKTDSPRAVPVHPVLAKTLAEWKLSGWRSQYGRAPGPDDLICPSATGRHLRDTVVLRELHADCQALGLRLRRTHDTRRTFISLARADGANKDILRQVTHQPEGDVVDDYTTLPWEALCNEVLRLKIKPLDGQLLLMPVVANTGNAMPLQSQLQSRTGDEKAEQSGAIVEPSDSGRGGTRTLTNKQHQIPTENRPRQFAAGYANAGRTGQHRAPAQRSNVADALGLAREAWINSGDVEGLRSTLLALLAELDGGAQ